MGKAVSINRSKEFEPFVQKLAGETVITKAAKNSFRQLENYLLFALLSAFKTTKKYQLIKTRAPSIFKG